MFEYIIGIAAFYWVSNKISKQESRQINSSQNSHHAAVFWGPSGKLKQDNYIRDDLDRNRRDIGDWTPEEVFKIFGAFMGDTQAMYGPDGVKDDRSGVFDAFRGKWGWKPIHTMPEFYDF